MPTPRRRTLAVLALAMATVVFEAGAAPAVEGRPLVPATGSAVDEASPRSRSMGEEATRTAVALGAVLGLVLVVRHLARRRAPLGGAKGLAAGGLVETLGRTPLGRGRSIVLLRVGPRILCLHEGPQETRTLCEFTEPREVEPLLSALARGDGPVETVDLTRREPRRNGPAGRSA
jgi:flagellar biogenesis protein FliO